MRAGGLTYAEYCPKAGCGIRSGFATSKFYRYLASLKLVVLLPESLVAILHIYFLATFGFELCPTSEI